MPLIAIFLGAIMLIAGVRNTQGELIALWRDQTTGENSFFAWIFAIMAIGSLGYIKELQPLSRALLALVIVVILLSNSPNGVSVLEQLQKQLFGRYAQGGPLDTGAMQPSADRADDIRSKLRVIENV